MEAVSWVCFTVEPEFRNPTSLTVDVVQPDQFPGGRECYSGHYQIYLLLQRDSFKVDHYSNLLEKIIPSKNCQCLCLHVVPQLKQPRDIVSNSVVLGS